MIDQNKKGSQRQRLAAILQYCLPGVPCIYYGDERGMNGFLDPFNRETFQEAPYDLTQDYRQLAQLRNSADALQTGHVVFFAPDTDCIGVLRYVIGGRDALGRPAQDGVYFVAVNRSETSRLVVFDFLSRNPLFVRDTPKDITSVFNGTVTCQLTGKQYLVHRCLAGNYTEGFERCVAKDRLAKRKSLQKRRIEQNR